MISCFVAAVCVGVAATQLTAGILSAPQPAGLVCAGVGLTLLRISFCQVVYQEENDDSS